jgi:hypothetical protein
MVSLIWVRRGYDAFEDEGDQSAGDEVCVFGEDEGGLVAVLLVAVDDCAEGVGEAPPQ